MRQASIPSDKNVCDQQASFTQTGIMPERSFGELPADAMPFMHSDHGWQCMSRKGNCPDNSAMKNFFGRLKTEMFIGENFTSLMIFSKNLKNTFAISTMKEYL